MRGDEFIVEGFFNLMYNQLHNIEEHFYTFKVGAKFNFSIGQIVNGDLVSRNPRKSGCALESKDAYKVTVL